MWRCYYLWQDGQFWDGRAEDLVDQAGQLILNPIEMGKLQLDLELNDQQVNDVTAFLRTLTDKNREQYLK